MFIFHYCEVRQPESSTIKKADLELLDTCPDQEFLFGSRTGDCAYVLSHHKNLLFSSKLLNIYFSSLIKEEKDFPSPLLNQGELEVLLTCRSPGD